MKLEVINGSLCVTENGETLFDKLYVGARYVGYMWSTVESYKGQTWNVKKEGLPECFRAGECYRAYSGDSEITAVFADGKMYFRTAYKNGKEEKALNHLYGMEFVALGGMWHRYIDRALCNEWMEHNHISVCEMRSDISVKILADMEETVSASHTAFLECGGNAVSCGFIAFENYFSGAAVRSDGKIEFRLRFDTDLIDPEEKITSDWICIETADSMQKALMRYAEEVRDFNNIKLRFPAPPAGLCTWYYYLDNIREKVFTDNLPVLDELRKEIPVDIFQIDDGWGDVHTGEGNDRFPHGMKYAADLIKEHGMTPGIWLHPFDFDPSDKLPSEHPECFVHRNNELCLVNGRAVLDATYPLSREYIINLYHLLTYDFGYRYIKIDFVAPYLCPGDYYEKKAGALQNMRTYFKILREGCHPDTFILACTAPLMEMAGLCDGIRTSGDIFENWTCVPDVFRRNLNRFYMNGVLFRNDPDCYMIRTSGEEDSECRRLCSRTPLENRTFATAMYTASGALMFSDKLPLLSEKQLSDYKKFFPRKSKQAVPLDLETSFIPSVFDFGEEDGVRTLSFINWSDRKRTLSVSLNGTYSAAEHWDDRPLGEFTGEFSVSLEPHESLLAHFKNK